jgi:O-antigen/teichoic acid export membrane protein
MGFKKVAYDFLLKSQKISRTDNIYLGKQGFYTGINYAVIFALGLITSVVFARFVPKNVYGDYQYLLSIMALIGIFSLRGIPLALTRSVARGFEGNFRAAIKKRLAWAAAGSVVAIGLAGYYFLKNNYFLAVGCLIIAAFLPFIESADMFTAYLEGKKDFFRRAKLNIIFQIAYTAAMLLVVYFYPKTFPIFLTYLLATVAVKWAFNRSIGKETKNGQIDNDLINYGKHLSLMQIIAAVAQQLNSILTFHYLGPIELAIFSFANLPQSQAIAILGNLRTIAFPKLAENDKEIQIKAWLRKLALLGAIIVLGVILYMLIAPWLFGLFFPNYLESVKYSRALFLLILLFPFSFLPLIFAAQKMQKELYQWNIVSASLEILLLFLLIPAYGLWGLIYATLAAKTVSAIISITLFIKAFKKTPSAG